jgi:hypothetical protein
MQSGRNLLTFPQNFRKIVCDYTASHSEDRIIIVTTVGSSDLTTTIHLTRGMAMGIKPQTLHWSKGEQSHESNPSKSTVSYSVYFSIFPSSQPASHSVHTMPVVINVTCNSIIYYQADSPR